MKLPNLLLLTLCVLLLSSCSPKLTENTQKSDSNEQSATQSQENKKEMDDVKVKIVAMKEKYSNPKQATLRNDKFERKGKVYMQYDKATKKTYFWIETDGINKEDELSVVLIDNKKKDDNEKRLEVGKIIFDTDGKGYLYYEFDKEGNNYNYLEAEIMKGKDLVVKAYFNPKLS
jgi:hypothetical protein